MRLSWTFVGLILCSWAMADTSYQRVIITEYGDVDVLQLVTEDRLPEPGPGEVRLRVLTASASFTDVMVRRGRYPGVEVKPPYPPGYDLVGVVDKLGEGVSGLAVGQRVADLTVWGAYTEYALRPADGLVPLPDGLPAEEAVVLVLAYITAYQMLYRVADVQPDQRVLIHGASGAVGTALAQLGRMSGLEMYGTASTAKQDYVRALGVEPIDYKTEDFVERVEQLTDGEGVHVVFDAIGPVNFKRSYSVLKPDGLLVEYGLYKAAMANTFDMLLSFARWQWQELLWRWFPDEGRRTTFYSIQDQREAEPEWFRNDLAALFQLALEGTVDPEVWRVMPLAEAAEAHRLIESGQVRGKIVLRVGDDGAVAY